MVQIKTIGCSLRSRVLHTVLWTAFMLCGQIGPIEKRPLLQSMTAPAFGAATSRLTAQWVGELTGQWVNGLRDCRSDTHRVEALPGGALVNSVVQQAVQVFRIHRRCVRNNTDYQSRTRDPLELVQRRQAYIRKLIRPITSNKSGRRKPWSIVKTTVTSQVDSARVTSGPSARGRTR